VAITEDGFGVQLGKSFARASIEIFTEPQCPHCADLQFFFGDEIADYVNRGDLVVTYRMVTFLDNSASGYSHRVGNALLLAADPKADASAADILPFVQELYWQMNPGGPNIDDAGIAKIAKAKGLPSQVVDRIDAGETGVDVTAMDNANEALLKEVRPKNPGTPTVYDTNAKQLVDMSNDNWLHNLVQNT
jgi:hypothetical protein